MCYWIVSPQARGIYPQFWPSYPQDKISGTVARTQARFIHLINRLIHRWTGSYPQIHAFLSRFRREISPLFWKLSTAWIFFINRIYNKIPLIPELIHPLVAIYPQVSDGLSTEKPGYSTALRGYSVVYPQNNPVIHNFSSDSKQFLHIETDIIRIFFRFYWLYPNCYPQEQAGYPQI